MKNQDTIRPESNSQFIKHAPCKHCPSSDAVAVYADGQGLRINYLNTTTTITSTLMRKAILRSLLRGSIKTKQNKKKSFFLTRNGRIKLIILRGGNQRQCLS